MYFDTEINSSDNIIKTTWERINSEAGKDIKHIVPLDSFNKYYSIIASSILQHLPSDSDPIYHGYIGIQNPV